MKKTKIMVVLLAMTAMPAFAQTDDGDFNININDERKNIFYVAPRFGGSFSTMGQPIECELYDGSGLGFSGGLAIGVRLGKATSNSPAGTGYLGLGFELAYRQNAVKTKGTDETGKGNANLTTNYFEVPVFVQFFPFAKYNSMNTFRVELGTAIDFSMGCSPENLTVDNPNAEISSIVYHINDDKSKLKGIDVRPFAGLGYTIPGTGLDLGMRYYLGTSELAGNFPCKTNSLEVALAWKINVSKF